MSRKFRTFAARLGQPALRIPLGAALLTALLMASGPRALWAHFEGVEPYWLGLAVPLYAASLLVRGVRWWLLLQPLSPQGNWLDTTAISTLGWSLNNVLPFRLGEVMRVYLFGLRSHLSIAALLPSAVAERLLDVAVLVGTMGGGLLLLGLSGAGGIEGTGLPTLGAGLFFLLGVGLALWILPHLRLPSISSRRRAARLLSRLFDLFARYQEATRLCLRPSNLARGLGLTALAWALQALQYATFFAAFGAEIHPLQMAVAFALFMLTFAINLVPGQLGTYEAFFVLAFSVFHATDPELLLAIALGTHATNLVLLSLLGVASYLKLGIDRAVLREAWNLRAGRTRGTADEVLGKSEAPPVSNR